MANSTRSVITGSAATFLGTAIAAILSVGYVSFGAHQLGPSAYAEVAVAISTANIVFILLNPVEAGLTLQIAGFTGRSDQAGLREFLRRALRGLALLGVVGLLIAGSAGAWSHSPAALLWLGAFCSASLVANLPRAALRGREQFAALAANWILESAVRIAGGLALVYLGLGPAGMVAGYAFGTVAAAFHGMFVVTRGLPQSAATAGAGSSMLSDVLLPLRSVSAPLLGLHLYNALSVNVDMLVASETLSAHDAGIYGGAASLARIVLVGAHPLLLVLFSRLASLSAARADTGAVMRFGTVLVLGGLTVSLLIPWFGAELLLRSFLGAAYVGAADILLWQWATACVLIAQAFFAESMLATSHVRGGFVFVLPALALLGALALWHDSALTIARTSFIVCASVGSATFGLLWRWRTPTFA